ncbi:MAG TPA: GNAT family N-acetyltransferase [Tichowtungia sp.]|nr:GNAT family N-acetyltransferase [Tichowtungia sp.]
MEINSSVDVRTATIDDLGAIFHLGEKVFTSQEVSNLYRTWDEYEVTHLFNSESEHVLVAEFDGTVVGFAMGTVIQKARSAWNYGHLLWLGVDPDCARRGVGSILFDRFRERMEAEGVRMLMIDTQADNLAAIGFFERKGFENPTDHVYMTLNLGKEE